MFAYEVIFGVPVEKLFPILYEEVEYKTRQRAHLLAVKLKKVEGSRETQNKLQVFEDIASPKANEPAETL